MGLRKFSNPRLQPARTFSFRIVALGMLIIIGRTLRGATRTLNRTAGYREKFFTPMVLRKFSNPRLQPARTFSFRIVALGMLIIIGRTLRGATRTLNRTAGYREKFFIPMVLRKFSKTRFQPARTFSFRIVALGVLIIIGRTLRGATRTLNRTADLRKKFLPLWDLENFQTHDFNLPELFHFAALGVLIIIGRTLRGATRTLNRTVGYREKFLPLWYLIFEVL